MIRRATLYVLSLLPFCAPLASQANPFIDPSPHYTVSGDDIRYSLVNSVHYHPKLNLFCAAYTHNNKIVLYTLDATGKAKISQVLRGELNTFGSPQHAAFSPDGNLLATVNWATNTLYFFKIQRDGNVNDQPLFHTPPAKLLEAYKPHGMAFSPNGKFLAVAYGASSGHHKGIGLYRMRTNACELCDLLDEQDLPGIPKGITFSPDGNCLLVTFCDVNSIVIYDVNPRAESIFKYPRQIVQGPNTDIFRPEDIKIAPNGDYLVISNSEQHNVAFFFYDAAANLITQDTPFYVHKNPAAKHTFPHSLAFSPDGKYFLISQFGNIRVTDTGRILWDKNTEASQAKIHIYKLKQIP